MLLKYCDDVSNNNWTQNSIYVKTNKIKHFTIPNTIQLSVSEACHKKMNEIDIYYIKIFFNKVELEFKFKVPA